MFGFRLLRSILLCAALLFAQSGVGWTQESAAGAVDEGAAITAADQSVMAFPTHSRGLPQIISMRCYFPKNEYYCETEFVELGYHNLFVIESIWASANDNKPNNFRVAVSLLSEVGETNLPFFLEGGGWRWANGDLRHGYTRQLQVHTFAQSVRFRIWAEKGVNWPRAATVVLSGYLVDWPIP